MNNEYLFLHLDAVGSFGSCTATLSDGLSLSTLTSLVSSGIGSELVTVEMGLFRTG